MIEPIYVHRETYRAIHEVVVAHMMLYHRYDLKTAKDETDQMLMPLRYISNDRLTEHEAV